eukprot:CAMPEP_0198108176 /NCGR_PEP_ID=MMETSP1442-20131203/264_1 /TAXON_ID= /ORGANISM="Craspedostauros australis, Strain CCMP3328" /LENGTH=229 /DNA_ID=CAMNT_0043763399 /DNA_START=352 /DNA_END=1042 /DNA_ORIENTATION=-
MGPPTSPMVLSIPALVPDETRDESMDAYNHCREQMDDMHGMKHHSFISAFRTPLKRKRSAGYDDTSSRDDENGDTDKRKPGGNVESMRSIEIERRAPSIPFLRPTGLYRKNALFRPLTNTICIPSLDSLPSQRCGGRRHHSRDDYPMYRLHMRISPRTSVVDSIVRSPDNRCALFMPIPWVGDGECSDEEDMPSMNDCENDAAAKANDAEPIAPRACIPDVARSTTRYS